MTLNRMLLLMIGITAVTTELRAQDAETVNEPAKTPAEQPAEPTAEKADEKQAISLKKSLMPIFARSCVGCHQREGGNARAIEHKVFYEKPEDVMAQVGRFIVAAEPAKSHLLYLVTPPKSPDERKEFMPPPRSQAQKLSEKEIELLKTWIQQGAKNN